VVVQYKNVGTITSNGLGPMEANYLKAGWIKNFGFGAGKTA